MAGKKPQKIIKRAAKAAANELGFNARSRWGLSVPALIIAAFFIGAIIYGAVLEKKTADISSEPKPVTENFVQKDADLEVHYINVGQGDCSLIRYNGINILTDAGEKEYGDTVENYLKNLGVTKLDYIISTHPHSDHMGGLPQIIADFDIGKVIAPKISEEMTPTTSTYEKFLKALNKKGLKLTAAKPGTILSLANDEIEGDNTCITILAPVSDSYDDLNNFSIVFKLTHGTTTFLFTGDAEKQAEEDIVASGADVSADVLKVGHHGSSTSTKKEFLEAVSPKYAVIQVGTDNSYNHPNDKTVERLDNFGVKIFRNDKDGTVIFYSDGTDIRAVKEDELNADS